MVTKIYNLENKTTISNTEELKEMKQVENAEARYGNNRRSALLCVIRQAKKHTEKKDLVFNIKG